MWKAGVLSGLLYLSLAYQACLWQLDKAFFFLPLPLGLSLPNSCQRSQNIIVGFFKVTRA